MGKISFPLINVRKDVTNSWHMNHYTGETAEELTIPTAQNKNGYYTVFLTERPDNGSIPSVTSRPIIDGYTEYTAGTPINKDLTLKLSDYEYYVNYDTGEILFNKNAAGDIIKVDYWGRGSVVEAEDINVLYDRIINVENSVGLSFTSFTINGSSNVYVPIQTYYPVNGSLVFNWSTKDSKIFKDGSVTIKNITTGETLATGLSSSGTKSVSISRIIFDKKTTYTYQISGQTTSGFTFTRNATVTWDYYMYYGTLPSNSIDSFTTTGLTGSTYHDFPGSFSGSNYYPVIVCPSIAPEPTSFFDKSTGIAIVVTTPGLIDIPSSDGLKVTYRVYSSLNKIPNDTLIGAVL